MNQFIDNELIKEVNGSQNVMYILSDKSLFSLTQYKVMKNYFNQGLVKCSKSVYNGQLKLVYFNEQLKPLSSMLETINLSKLLSIIERTLEQIVELKKNGFLDCCNLDFTIEKIFVDVGTMNVKLVYLPLEIEKNDISTFEKNLIMAVSEMIASAPRISIHIANRFCNALLIENKTVEEAYKYIKTNRQIFESENVRPFDLDEKKEDESQIEPESKTDILQKGSNQSKLILVCADTDNPTEFVVDKNEFVIGKKRSAVDGHITGNSAISRVHCVIMRNENNFYVTDLGSANGTFINGDRLSVAEKHDIQDGDVLRLANITFSVTIQ